MMRLIHYLPHLSLTLVWACMAWVLTIFSACDYKELCYNHPHKKTAQVVVPVNWSKFTEEQPTGMTVMAFPDDGGAPQTVLSNYLGSAEFVLKPGVHHILVFNQSTSEFGSLHFEGMDKYSTARVLANSYVSRWYKSRGDEDRAIAEPEWLAHGGLDEVLVTDGMIHSDSVYVTDTVKPRNVVYTIHVRIHVKGIYNVRSARASLNGMAEGYLFATGKPSESRIAQLLEKWTLTADTDNPVNGVLSADIQSFGLPNGHRGIASENNLNLSLLLVDNKTQLDYSFAVGDQFKRMNQDVDVDVPAEELNLELSLDLGIDTPIPDVKPEGGSSGGFDATVEDWGDEEHIDIGV